LDPNAESDSEVGSNKGLFTKTEIYRQSRLEQREPKILRAVAGGQNSDGRAGRQADRQAGRQAGKQGNRTRANGGNVSPEAEEIQVSTKTITKTKEALEYTILYHLARNTT